MLLAGMVCLLLTVDTVRAADDLDPANGDWTLILDQAVSNKAVHVFLARRDGKWVQAIASTPEFNRGVHTVDLDDLELDGDKLAGRLGVRVNPDPWVPRDGKPIPSEFTIDASVADGKVTGSYEGTAGSEAVSGPVSGSVDPAAGALESGTVKMRLENALTGDQPHVCMAEVTILLRQGEAKKTTFSWPAPGNKGRFFWLAQITEADWKLTPHGFTGELAVRITPNRGRVDPGEYRFTLTARRVGSQVAGTFTAKLGDRELPGGTFLGTIGK
jgi:hypothetical protein